MSPAERTHVVIVGAGPTGPTAAVRLAQLGIPTRRPGRGSRTDPYLEGGVGPHVDLELLSELGVGDDLTTAGRRCTAWSWSIAADRWSG